MKLLAVEIDCNKTTCGKCQLIAYTNCEDVYCAAFGKELEETIRYDKFIRKRKRLPECIKHELLAVV